MQFATACKGTAWSVLMQQFRNLLLLLQFPVVVVTVLTYRVVATSFLMHPVGETLLESVRVRRVKVVQGLLRAGIPLSKADSLRDLFEENSTTLTSSADLHQLIPFI